jgi:hypothetical protein
MVTLKEWVPALAERIYGPKWSPNLDFTTHLEAQREARKLGIGWAADMPAADVERISAAMLARYGK